ncbi:MAG TPA: copper resistance system multicopper oxidase [Gammaproteobacteria bacterium]|nr:copper resistance system multicopper oxidase [Gammaproteobacteria bacterium]
MQNYKKPPRTAGLPAPARRRFVQGLLAGGVLAGSGIRASLLLAADALPRQPQVLGGNRFELTLDETPVNYTGRNARATTVNGSLPAPTLRWREGQRVTLRVTNRLPVLSAIHWHGVVLPFQMDGVPSISFDGIAPGETFTYEFDVRQSGTYWYHSHGGFQEQTGMYGALIIDPVKPEPFAYERDYVVMLSDWTDEDPETIYAHLKKSSHYYSLNERTAGDVWDEIRTKGVAATWRGRAMWNRMRMSDRDLSDVTGASYTYLMNGRAPAAGWTGFFKRGERVRLRFINGSSMTFFDVRIPGLKMRVVAADGHYIEPVTVDEFRMGVAETYDVIVEPREDEAYTVFAQALDRSGYARGALTPDIALQAAVPELDPVPVLTHADMGMGHGGHGTAEDHSTHAGQGGTATADHGAQSAAEHGHDASSHGAHAGHGIVTGDPSAPASGKAGYGSTREIRHLPSEYGPQVDMRSSNPQYRLDDPGPGLRNNGRRVLSYADLKNLNSTRNAPEPGREIDLHLTGNMHRYMWSMNGIKHEAAEPLRLKYGERVRINLINDTMMNHPVHLHGMWSDLETGDPDRIPRKHTVTALPGAKISYLVSADALGAWAYHCHLLYHMPGMMRTVVVSEHEEEPHVHDHHHE